MVVQKVLSAIDLEIEKYADVWKDYIAGSDTLPDSTGLFIRAMGSRAQPDPVEYLSLVSSRILIRA
jgi:hypothetical protein